MKKIILSITLAFAIFAIGLTSLASMYAQSAQHATLAESQSATEQKVQAAIDSATNHSGLTSEQIYNLSMRALEMQEPYHFDVSDNLIPIVFFLFVAGVVFLALFYAAKDKKRKYALMEKALEKGQTIPELSMKKKERNAFHHLTNGIIFTFLGLSFFVVHLVTDRDNPMPFIFIASFFIAFGLAFLLVGAIKWRMEKKDKAQKQNNAE